MVRFTPGIPWGLEIACGRHNLRRPKTHIQSYLRVDAMRRGTMIFLITALQSERPGLLRGHAVLNTTTFPANHPTSGKPASPGSTPPPEEMPAMRTPLVFRTLTLVALLASPLVSRTSAAKPLSLASLFTNHAVLQRDLPVPVWGKRRAGYQSRRSIRRPGKTTTAERLAIGW